MTCGSQNISRSFNRSQIKFIVPIQTYMHTFRRRTPEYVSKPCSIMWSATAPNAWCIVYKHIPSFSAENWMTVNVWLLLFSYKTLCRWCNNLISSLLLRHDLHGHEYSSMIQLWPHLYLCQQLFLLDQHATQKTQNG